MSSSAGTKVAVDRKVQPFSYDEVVSSSAKVSSESQAPQISPANQPKAALSVAEREQARMEGESRARVEYEAQLSKIHAAISETLSGFARDRTTYFQRIEGEVVQLALSIARKILHRESQVDPLLLAGMVHVALKQIENSTKTTVRVHPNQVSTFRSYFAHHMDAQEAPEVIEDANVARECCVLHTSVGTTQIGIEPQLKEIEQGLFDLMAHRPEVRL
jgi:flagellar assembly protein FliH